MNLPGVCTYGSREPVEVGPSSGPTDAQFAALLALVVPQVSSPEPEPAGRAEFGGPVDRADGSIQREEEQGAVPEGEKGERCRASTEEGAVAGPGGLTPQAAHVHVPVPGVGVCGLLEAPATDGRGPDTSGELAVGPRQPPEVGGFTRATPSGLPPARQTAGERPTPEARARDTSEVPSPSPPPAAQVRGTKEKSGGADPVPFPPQFHGEELELPRVAAGRGHAAGAAVLSVSGQEHSSEVLTAAPSPQPPVSPAHPGPAAVSPEVPRAADPGRGGKPRGESGAAVLVDGLGELRVSGGDAGLASAPGLGSLPGVGGANVPRAGGSVGQDHSPEGFQARGGSGPGLEAQPTVAASPPPAPEDTLREPGMQAAASSDSAGAAAPEVPPQEEAVAREPRVGRFKERAERTLEVAQRTGRAGWTPPQAQAGREEGAPREPDAAAPAPPEKPPTSPPQRLRLELQDTQGEPVRVEVRARSDTVWARVEASPGVAQAVRGELVGLHQALGGRGLSLAGLEVDILPRGRGRGPDAPMAVGTLGRGRTQRRVEEVRLAAGSVDYVV